MMFDFLEGILYELKDIPGLQFLKKLHASLRIKSARVKKDLQTLRNRQNDIRQGVKKIGTMAQNSKGSKRRDS